jgi:hypothetical protein
MFGPSRHGSRRHQMEIGFRDGAGRRRRDQLPFTDRRPSARTDRGSRQGFVGSLPWLRSRLYGALEAEPG